LSALEEIISRIGDGPEWSTHRRRLAAWVDRRILRPGRQAHCSLTDTPGDIRERLVPVLPSGDRLPLLGQGLELADGGGGPGVDGAEDDRDDAGRARLVPLHRPLDFDVPDVPRGEEVGTEHQEDD